MCDLAASLPPVEETDEAQFRLYALHMVGEVLSLTLDLDALLASTIDMFLQLTRADAGFVMLVDERTGALVFGAAKGLKQDVIERIRVNIEKDIAREIAQRQPPVLLADVKESRLGSFFQELLEPLGEVEIARCFPLVSSGKLVGLINISKSSSGSIFTKTDPHLLFATVCNRVAVAVENAHLYRRLQQKLEELRQRTCDLGERLKELNCLYGISRLAEEQDLSLDEIVRRTVELIPRAWQYPEITCARIILEGREFKMENFRETHWKQASDITVHGERAGTVEVGYLEEKPESEEGPFLREERDLINAVAERLGDITGRKRAERLIKELAHLYENTLATISSSILVLDGKLKIMYANPSYLAIRGIQSSDVLGKNITDVFPASVLAEQSLRAKLFGAHEDEVVIRTQRGSSGNRCSGRTSCPGHWRAIAELPISKDS